ncbi:MAG: response regulator transcription factor [Clostridia bacterium]|nr:response regulator transcription factor [Clostridia bacterium]
MLSLLFCDDDLFFLRLIRSLTESLLTEHSFSARCIGTSTCPEEVLRLHRNTPGPCLVFLDLDLGGGKLSGIDIARSLREKPDTRVVFVTGHRERAMEILQSGAQPYGFLDKTIDLSRLAMGVEKYLRMALREMRTDRDSADPVRLTVQGEEVLLLRREIVYLETEKRLSHGITYHTSGGSALTILGTLEQEKERLGGHFLRIHRSYLVQDIHMTALRSSDLLLSDGTVLPCSVSARGEVKAWLAAH